MPGGQWGDTEELGRWQAAADRVAERVRAERGVEEPVRLAVSGGAVWVGFGDLRLRVAGEGAELDTEQELFDDVDAWVAFDRRAGPGRVLDRDRAVVARVLARMPAAVQRWTRAVARVEADLRATTDLRWTFSFRVQEDEPQWPVTPQGSGVHLTALGPVETLDVLDPWQHLPRRAVSLPQLWLECDAGWGSTVDPDEDPEAAAVEAADRIASGVVDELWGAWPACPHHAHPLEPSLAEETACWVCPTRGDVVVRIGSLGRA